MSAHAYPTLREALTAAARAYLAEVVASSPDMTEAARRAGVNRTSFHRLCARFGIGVSKQRSYGAIDSLALLSRLRPPQRFERVGEG